MIYQIEKAVLSIYEAREAAIKQALMSLCPVCNREPKKLAIMQKQSDSLNEWYDLSCDIGHTWKFSPKITLHKGTEQ